MDNKERQGTAVLPITNEQHAMLQELNTQMERSKREFNIAYAAILRGHGHTKADLVALSPTGIVVRLPHDAP